MEAIYAKYNRERLPKFQIETIIYKGDKGKIVKKSPLVSEAKNHINKIYYNYKLLDEEFIKVVPAFLGEKEVTFEYIEGVSYVQLLLEACSNKNKDNFFQLLSSFSQLINGYSTAVFRSCNEFEKIFGISLELNNINCVKVANVDFTFENIVVDSHEEFYLIDYEWVFEFEVPVSFLLYRAINSFWIRYREYFEMVTSFEEVLQFWGIEDELRDKFVAMEQGFQTYVYGVGRTCIVTQDYIKPVYTLGDIEHEKNLALLQSNNLEAELKRLKVESEEENKKKRELINGLEVQINELEVQNDKLKEELLERIETAKEQGFVLTESKNEIESLQNKLKEVNYEVAEIKSSHGYQFLINYYRICDKIFPPHSRRKYFIKMLTSRTKIKKAVALIKRGKLQQFLLKLKNQFSTVKAIKETKREERTYSFQLKDILEKKSGNNFNKSIEIDIIIPIYNALDYLKKCIGTVYQNTDMDYNLYLLNDCSPDKNVYKYLEELKSYIKPHNLKKLMIVHNNENLGFVKNVNKGFKLTKNHVVLLNTDTEVPPKWLSRLINPILSDNQIASVTPFSNCATICSFPKFCEDNELPQGMDVNELDKLFYEFGSEKVIDLPTAVGFCMAINKKAINDIGIFDEKTFEKGYGEENDWCMRAFKKGYKNVLAPNLFVYHKHGVSFGEQKDKNREARMLENLRRLESKHPDYSPWVQKFIQDDPIKPIRNVLISALIARQQSNRPGVLLINHSLGGGTQYYQDAYIDKHKYAQRNYTLALQGEKFIIKDLNTNDDNSFYMENREINQDTFNSIIKWLNIDSIYINQLVTFPVQKMVQFMMNAKIPYTCFVHDFFYACPSYNLINNNGSYCFNERDITKCQKCLINNELIQGIPNLSDRVDILEWRRMFSEFLLKADKVLAPSHSVKNIMQLYYPKLEVHVKEHEIITPLTNTFEASDIKKKELTIGFIGAIGENKGSNIVYDLKEKIDNYNLPIKIKVIGITNVHSESYISSNGKFEVTGPYDNKEISYLLRQYGINVVVISSICPETFSYTASEALMSGYPVITFKLGAPADKVRKIEGGWVIEEIGSDSLINLLLELLNNPDQIIQKHINIKKYLDSMMVLQN